MLLVGLMVWGVTSEQVSLGALATAVPRDAVDHAVVACGVRARRAGGKLRAHVVAYLTMALCLIAEDDYEGVAAKVTGSLSAWGCWDASWSVPTAGGITQARKRLGPKVGAEVFERGAWLRDWRLLAIAGFDVDLPDTPAFPKARVLALAECDTHAFLAAEVGPYSTGKKTWPTASTRGCAPMSC